MPRRRSTKTKPSSGKSRPVNRGEGKIKKWDKVSDIPLDEEDQFHNSRDKVLLQGDDSGGDDYGDDDEVFALNGMGDEGTGSVDMEEEEEGEEEEEMLTRPKKSKKSKKQKTESSSEEESDDDEDESWGRNKSAYYSSNAAQLESDDDEGNELEEQENIRLQRKLREGMIEGDFGLNDALDIEDTEEIDSLSEPTPTVAKPLPQDHKLLIQHLERTSPETLALARDWEDTIEILEKTRVSITKISSEDSDALSLGMLHLYYQTLLTYSTTLAFYLHLRSSEKYAQRPELLKSHPILSRLLTLKRSLITLEELDFAPSDSEDSEDDDGDSMTFNDILMDGESIWNMDENLDNRELNDLLKDAASKEIKIEAREPMKKKRKTSTQSSKPKAPVFDLVEPNVTSFTSSSRNQPKAGTSEAYGEATSLEHADAADKTARKKSLRFHTSKIESASARRQGARSQAVGGDDDLPYRERRKEKETRIAKEAAAKVRGQGGDDLDQTEPEHRPDKRRREEESEEESEAADGYYELIQRKVKQKKEQKKLDYESAQAAARPDMSDQDSAMGPRSLTRAISANKGLTPHRPKSVRNPRVKKRQKFEKAKKKIASQKAVYKGGLAETGRYDGEKSGISKVVKSIPLG